MKEKKLVLTVLVAAVAMMAAFASPAMATVSGPCTNCHTMHYSQAGAEPGDQGFPSGLPYDLWGADGPYSALTVNDCLGCHTTNGGEPYDNPSGYPYVMDQANAFDDDRSLAGGFFNPNTVGNQDNNSDMNHTLESQALPAGYDPGEVLGDWYTGDTSADGLQCAGSNGCHGVHDVEDDDAAISGGHHSPSTYRMLFVGNNRDTDAVLGVGASDYEEDLIATPDLADPRNVYSGDVLDPSISGLCALCHGNFHNEYGSTEDAGAGSPWLRHPADVVIPDEWNIGQEAIPLTASDYKNNPVGYRNADESLGRRVICVSCHRAHGTEQDDLLRWLYSTQEAGSTTVTYGCLGCHDRQRG